MSPNSRLEDLILKNTEEILNDKVLMEQIEDRLDEKLSTAPIINK